MNFRKIIVPLACGLAVCASAGADDLALNNAPQPDSNPGNPYGTIVTRNVFGLNPPNLDTKPAEDPDLPKITPNGIQSVFGKFQVLFKVTPTGKNAKNAVNQYYALSEGERQDDIEVVSINDEKSVVTFKNHGTVQELPLAEAPSSGSGALPLPPRGNPAFNPANGNNNENGGPGNRISRFGNRGGGPGGFNRRGNNQGEGATGEGGEGGLNLRSIPTRTYQPQASQLTPEETVIQIEKNRYDLIHSAHPAYSPALLPTTPLTHDLNPEAGQ